MSTEIPGAHNPGYRSPRERIRWIPLKNMESSKTIPGHAIVYLDVTQGNDFFSQEAQDDGVVFRGKQCDSVGEASQDPALFVVNGPTPIPPGQIGRCNQDWPAQVIHDGSDDRLPNGFTCGPRADTWEIYSTGNAFTCLSHDACQAVNNRPKGIHTVWISPSTTVATPAAITTGGGTADNGDKLTLDAADDSENWPGARAWSLTESGDAFKIYDEGIWWLQVSATLSSSSTTEGSTLRIRAYANGSPTALQGTRLHIIDTSGGTVSDDAGDYWSDPYFGGSPIFTEENVAFGGPVLIEHPAEQIESVTGRPYSTISVRSGSNNLVYGTLVASVFKLAAQRADPSGVLKYAKSQASAITSN